MDDNYTYFFPGYVPFDTSIYCFEERVAGLAERGGKTYCAHHRTENSTALRRCCLFRLYP